MHLSHILQIASYISPLVKHSKTILYHVVSSEVITVVVKRIEDSSEGPEDEEGSEDNNKNHPTVTHDG